jgi:hypothetical protein
MKNLILILPVLAFLAGCSTTPTPTEQHFFDIKTNYVPHIVVVTNVTPTGTSVVTITNQVAEYVYTPGTNATTITTTAGAIGNLFGVGGLVTTLLGGLWAAWAQMRSRKSTALAGALMQAIETGSEILKTVPQGLEMDAKWKAWMQANQKEAGVLVLVLDMMSKVVDNDSAKAVAARLLALMKERQPPTG